MSKLKDIVDHLREEYGVPGRRDGGDGVRSLIRVILSQNTNSKNTRRAYERIWERFDSPEDFLEVDQGELAEVISVAGLHNMKAERIKESLKRIEEERGDLSLDFLGDMSLDEARDWLMELPGVGPKSAAIVLNFQFDKEAFPVDTHVFRVSKRLGLIPDETTRERAHILLEEMVPGERMFEVHVNLIRHGREVCRAPTPACSSCFMTDICDYFKEGKGPKK